MTRSVDPRERFMILFGSPDSHVYTGGWSFPTIEKAKNFIIQAELGDHCRILDRQTRESIGVKMS